MASHVPPTSPQNPVICYSKLDIERKFFVKSGKFTVQSISHQLVSNPLPLLCKGEVPKRRILLFISFFCFKSFEQSFLQVVQGWFPLQLFNFVQVS